MAKVSKKVVIIIVEGNSDESLLYERLKELFSPAEIRFEPYHGDLFNDLRNRDLPIKEVVGSFVKQKMQVRKFQKEDILAVIHIVDTDGVFISEDKVIVDGSQAALTIYKNDRISVANAQQQSNIIRRNSNRSGRIREMYATNLILGRTIDYKLYYFSRNLEHVLFNEPNPNEDDKCERVEDFLEELELHIEDFLDTHFPPISRDPQHDFSNSWRYVAGGVNSLQRLSNTTLLFEFIRSKMAP